MKCNLTRCTKPSSPPLDKRAAAEHDRPKIAITVHPRRGLEYYVPYRRAVVAAGADPVDLVPGTTALPAVDGLLLPGGWDVDPSFYGERRDEKVGETDPELDETELAMFHQARERDLPVVRDRGAYVTERPPAEGRDLTDLAPRAVGVVASEPGCELGFDGDGRERVAEQVVEITCNPGPLVLRREARQLRPSLRERPIAVDHPAEPEHREPGEGDGDRGAVAEPGAPRVWQSMVAALVAHLACD